MIRARKTWIGIFALLVPAGWAQDCWKQKTDLTTQAFTVSDPRGLAVSMGISPILYLAFVEGGEGEIASIEDLSKALNRIKPSLGDPGTIRIKIIQGIRKQWQKQVSTALLENPAITDDELLRIALREIEGSLPRSGYRAFSHYQFAATRFMNFFGTNSTYSYQFFISGEGAQRTLSLVHVRGTVTAETMNPWGGRLRPYSNYPWDDFIERFFDHRGMLQHLMRDVPLEGRSLGPDLLQYLHRIKILEGLTDDDVLQFIAKGDQAVLRTLRQTYAEGGEEGLRAALAAVERASLRRGGRGWVILGGLALGVGAIVAWATGPDDLEKFIQYFSDRYPGTREDPVSVKTLKEIIEIQDQNTLVETIHALGCHNANVLWNIAFRASDYPTG